MKNQQNVSKSLLLKIGAVGLLFLSLSSCLKQSTPTYYNPPSALLTFIQASPDEPPLDLYLDNGRVNVNPILYGDDYDYFKVYTGQRKINFYTNGSMTTVLADTATFLQNVAYSLFLTGKTTKPEMVLLRDSITRPNTGSANIRFINLSPDAPAVSLVSTGTGGKVLAGNIAYKGHTAFASIPANSYDLEIRQGTTTTVLATLPAATFNNGFVYTIWLNGLVTSTNNTDKLKIGIITNAYYY